MGISLDNHQQTSFLAKYVVDKSQKHEIPVVVQIHLSFWTNTQHRSDLVPIAGPMGTRATCGCMQQDSTWVERARWLLHIAFSLEANNLFLRTSDIVLLSSSSELPTSFHYHLPLHSDTCKSWLHEHLNKVRADCNRAERQLLHPICQPLRLNYTADTTKSTAMLQMQLVYGESSMTNS